MHVLKGLHALKGHGTQNDFVVLPDPDGALVLTPRLVQALCDRRAGIGGDGVLRLVRCENDPEAKEYAGAAEFFMDYRNADGSLAEMCGNGIRVCYRYLQRAGLAAGETPIATRGGIMTVRPAADGQIGVALGEPAILAECPAVTSAPVLSERRALRTVLLPNPHVVVAVGAAELDQLDLVRPPLVEPALPQGQNVEFVTSVAPRHLRMRVHERGVGETRSCGTGIAATAVASAAAAGCGADGTPWLVDVPGGRCRVVWDETGVELTGPAVLVAEIEVDEAWLAAARA